MGNFNQDKSYSRGSSDRETFRATCADCGRGCDLPFRPTTGRAVYCRDCFKKHSPDERRGRDTGQDRDTGRGRNEGRGRDRFSNRDNSRGSDREMFDATCADCGDKCRVPFMPRGGKDIFCSNCFEGKSGDSRKNTNDSSKQLNDINEKLNKILNLLSPTVKEKISKPKTPKVTTETVEPIMVEEITPETKEKEVKVVKKPRTKKKTKSK